jgi:hypothetical protein
MAAEINSGESWLSLDKASGKHLPLAASGYRASAKEALVFLNDLVSQIIQVSSEICWTQVVTHAMPSTFQGKVHTQPPRNLSYEEGVAPPTTYILDGPDSGLILGKRGQPDFFEVFHLDAE